MRSLFSLTTVRSRISKIFDAGGALLSALPLLLFVIVSPPFCQAGIREEFPEFFEKQAAVPAGQNGWELMLRLPEITDAAAEAIPWWQSGGAGWLESLDLEEVAQATRANHKAIEALEEILNCPVVRPGPDPLKAVESRALIRLVRAFRMYAAEAGLRARKGEATLAAERCWKVVAFCRRYCDAQPILIDTMAASAMMKLSIKFGAEIAVSGNLSPEDLRKAADACARQDGIGPVVQQTLLGEARWALQHYEPLLQGGEAMRDKVLEQAAGTELARQETARLASPGKTNVAPDTVESVQKRWKLEMPAELKSALAAAERTDWKTYFQDWALGYRAILKADMRSVPLFGSTYHPVKQRVSLKGGPLEAYFPESLDIDELLMRAAAETTADVRLARMAILLRAFEMKQGTLPESLQSLVPEYLKTMLTDPFDEKPLRYDRAARRVWSVGMNLKDENGEDEPDKSDGKDDRSFVLPPPAH